MITITNKIHFVTRNRRKQITDRPASVRVVPPGRIPRISRLMALAIRFDRLIREGKVTDQSELARLAHITQPRMTQIMNLLHLAPDIQEELLDLPSVTAGKDAVTERHLRPIIQLQCWQQQREGWKDLRCIVSGRGDRRISSGL